MAVGAGPRHLEGVSLDSEAVLPAQAKEPGIELAVLQLHDAVAFAADQMVMMSIAAEAVTDLPGTMGERVDDALLTQQRERAVDGRQPDRAPQPRVDLLGSRIVGLCGERAQDGNTLLRRTQSVTREQTLDACLRTPRHSP